MQINLSYAFTVKIIPLILLIATSNLPKKNYCTYVQEILRCSQQLLSAFLLLSDDLLA